MTAPDRIWCHPTERQPVPAKDRRNAKWVRGGWKDHNSNAHGDVEYIRADLAAVQPAQEVHEEQNTEQRERFWNWLPLAYRDGHIGEQAKFTKYNMEVAHYAGWCHALEPQPDHRDEVIKGLVEAATDAAEAIDMAYGSDDDESPHRHSSKLRAALAAAKAVQHG